MKIIVLLLTTRVIHIYTIDHDRKRKKSLKLQKEIHSILFILFYRIIQIQQLHAEQTHQNNTGVY
jgi:hypothetical protein